MKASPTVAYQLAASCHDPQVCRTLLLAGDAQAAATLRQIEQGRLANLKVSSILAVIPALTDVELQACRKLTRPTLYDPIQAEQTRRVQRLGDEELRKRLAAASASDIAGLIWNTTPGQYRVVLEHISSCTPSVRQRLLKSLVQGLPVRNRAQVLVGIVDGVWPELTVAEYRSASPNFITDVEHAVGELTQITRELAVELADCGGDLFCFDNIIDHVYTGALTVTPEAGVALQGGQRTVAALLVAAAGGCLSPESAILLFQQLCKVRHGAFLDSYAHLVTRAVRDSTAIAMLWGSCSNPGAGYGINGDVLVDAYDTDHPGLATLVQYSTPDNLAGLLRDRPDAAAVCARAILELEDTRARRCLIEDLFEMFAEARELFDVGRELLDGLLDAPGLVSLILEGHDYGKHAHELIVARLGSVLGDDLTSWQRFYALAGSWTGTLTELTHAVQLLEDQAA